ncbi:Uncharacterised protein [Klebsiella pneumoniae]|nr:Uncharacterised protein [Klebsiella pneumoniae]
MLAGIPDRHHVPRHLTAGERRTHLEAAHPVIAGDHRGIAADPGVNARRFQIGLQSRQLVIIAGQRHHHQAGGIPRRAIADEPAPGAARRKVAIGVEAGGSPVAGEPALDFLPQVWLADAQHIIYRAIG